MITMQQKLEDLIEFTIKMHHLEPVISHDFTNTGKIYAQTGLKTHCVITFSFQKDSATFTLDSVGWKQEQFHVDYHKDVELELFWEALRLRLRRGK